MLRDLQRRNSKMKNPKVGMLVNPHQRSRNPSLKDINAHCLSLYIPVTTVVNAVIKETSVEKIVKTYRKTIG